MAFAKLLSLTKPQFPKKIRSTFLVIVRIRIMIASAWYLEAATDVAVTLLRYLSHFCYFAHIYFFRQ